MAERLTKKITKTIQDKYSLGSYLYYDFNGAENTNRLLNKLGKLEDIMERLGINFVEDLEDEINSLRVDKYIYKQDRDTWKKACEKMAFNYDAKLKCSTCFLKEQCSKQYGGNYEQALSDYFYQQAKREGENENNKSGN